MKDLLVVSSILCMQLKPRGVVVGYGTVGGRGGGVGAGEVHYMWDDIATATRRIYRNFEHFA